MRITFLELFLGELEIRRPLEIILNALLDGLEVLSDGQI